MVLSAYEPQAVLKHFESISQIPRGSGNEKAVSDYVKGFCEGLGLRVVQDDLYNIVAFKGGTVGYENNPAVILQAHLDMVCEMNAGTHHDFSKDPIKLRIDGDIIKASGTTLGGDNGIGVALCMALLESTDIAHPPLEIVLTTEEETGMAGVNNLDFSLLQGRRLINLDSGEESRFTMGCAAGTTVEYFIPVEWTKVPEGFIDCAIRVHGLHGGHSGADIEKERGNALAVMGRILAAIQERMEVRLNHVNGGMKVNAIPRESSAGIYIEPSLKPALIKILEEIFADLKAQYRANDAGLEVSWTFDETSEISKSMPAESARNVIASLVLMPNGVIHMSTEIEGLVNSSCNLGVVETVSSKENTGHGVKILAMARGMAVSYNIATENAIRNLAHVCKAEVKFSERSPAWPYDPDSALLKSAVACYPPIFGCAPVVTAIHAGLECGAFSQNLPGVDIMSFGPNTLDIHTPEEGLSIASTARVWAFLQSLLGVL